jgi:hypothetical protein
VDLTYVKTLSLETLKEESQLPCDTMSIQDQDVLEQDIEFGVNSSSIEVRTTPNEFVVWKYLSYAKQCGSHLSEAPVGLHDSGYQGSPSREEIEHMSRKTRGHTSHCQRSMTPS